MSLNLGERSSEVKEMNEMIDKAISTSDVANYTGLGLAPYVCCRYLLEITCFPPTSKLIKSSDAIQRLVPLANHDNEMIREKAKSVRDYLQKVVDYDDAIPDERNIATAISKLFLTVDYICKNRFKGGLSSDNWLRVKVVMKRLLDLSEKEESDLSEGMKLGMTFEFISEHGEADIQVAAQSLRGKIDLDKRQKRLKECFLCIKEHANDVKRNVPFDWVSQKSVNNALGTLVGLPIEEVHPVFDLPDNKDNVRFVAEYGREMTKNYAERLLEKIVNEH